MSFLEFIPLPVLVFLSDLESFQYMSQKTRGRQNPVSQHCALCLQRLIASQHFKLPFQSYKLMLHPANTFLYIPAPSPGRLEPFQC